MKYTISMLLVAISTTITVGQSVSTGYFDLVRQADSLYKAGDYLNSAMKYSAAFRSPEWKGTWIDRFNAACSWALAGIKDSAFLQLDFLVKEMNFSKIEVTADTDLKSLHSDIRWTTFLEKIKQNKDKAEANLNKPLAAKLDSIYAEDQTYRLQIDEIEKKYGWESKEMRDHWKMIIEKDSINLIEVKSILDNYGWLGPDIVGEQGNTTLFLVIQHADLATQEKYLPMLREAVKNGKAQAGNLALLEDRVAIRHGKRQIYGSQIGRDNETMVFYVSPLEDPDNVDKRRANVGLPPLANYISEWNIKWDVEQYKKDLPKLEEKLKNKPLY